MEEFKASAVFKESGETFKFLITLEEIVNLAEGRLFLDESIRGVVCVPKVQAALGDAFSNEENFRCLKCRFYCNKIAALFQKKEIDLDVNKLVNIIICY